MTDIVSKFIGSLNEPANEQLFKITSSQLASSELMITLLQDYVNDKDSLVKKFVKSLSKDQLKKLTAIMKNLDQRKTIRNILMATFSKACAMGCGYGPEGMQCIDCDKYTYSI